MFLPITDTSTVSFNTGQEGSGRTMRCVTKYSLEKSILEGIHSRLQICARKSGAPDSVGAPFFLAQSITIKLKYIMRSILILVIYIAVSASIVLAHGGGLDSNGGHYNRKTGEYHYHRSPSPGRSVSPPTSRSTSRPSQLMQSQPSQGQKGSGIADEIRKLHDLYKQGVISKEDFEQGKRKLLR